MMDEHWRIVSEMAKVQRSTDRVDAPAEVALVLAAICQALLDLRNHKADS